MAPRRRKRADASLFGLPSDAVAAGTFSAVPLPLVGEALRRAGRSPRVVWQVSALREGWLGGIDEAVALLRTASIQTDALEVQALAEGNLVTPWETVLQVTGPYASFAHLETLVLGALGRGTRVVTTVRRLVEAARPKPLHFLGSDGDHASLQPADGLSAQIGGATYVSTAAHALSGPRRMLGQIPHSLVAACGGDVVAAARMILEVVGEGVPILAPVDYRNDSVTASLELARALEGRLWGVRLDTSSLMVDRSVIPLMGSFTPTGVNPALAWAVRNALDAEGFGEVKIVAAGELAVDGIRELEEDGVPIDAYAVRTTERDGQWAFAADVVEVDGVPESRAGREGRPNSRLLPA